MPANRWTGFYVGVFLGHGKGQTEWTDHFFGIKSEPFDGSGGLVGFAAGYNWQMGRWVYGIEGDASYTRIKASSPGPFLPLSAGGKRTSRISSPSAAASAIWSCRTRSPS